MNIKRTCVVVALILLLAGLAACTRSLTPSDKATQTSPEDVASEEVTPAAGTEVMGQLFLLATQTAMAQQGISVEELPEVSTEEAPIEVAPDITETAPVEGQEQDTTTAPTPKPTKVAVPTATPGKPDTYTLQQGEFPFCIARRFDVNPHELLRVSGIAPNTTLQPGTELKFPQTDRTYPGNRTLREHPTTYTVKSGDTIHSIACLFGDVAPDAIAYANGLQPPYELSLGMELHIP